MPFGGGSAGATGAGGATDKAWVVPSDGIVGDQHLGAGAGAYGADQDFAVEADGHALRFGVELLGDVGEVRRVEVDDVEGGTVVAGNVEIAGGGRFAGEGYR